MVNQPCSDHREVPAAGRRHRCSQLGPGRGGRRGPGLDAATSTSRAPATPCGVAGHRPAPLRRLPRALLQRAPGLRGADDRRPSRATWSPSSSAGDTDPGRVRVLPALHRDARAPARDGGHRGRTAMYVRALQHLLVALGETAISHGKGSYDAQTIEQVRRVQDTLGSSGQGHRRRRDLARPADPGVRALHRLTDCRPASTKASPMSTGTTVLTSPSAAGLDIAARTRPSTSSRPLAQARRASPSRPRTTSYAATAAAASGLGDVHAPGPRAPPRLPTGPRPPGAATRRATAPRPPRPTTRPVGARPGDAPRPRRCAGRRRRRSPPRRRGRTRSTSRWATAARPGRRRTSATSNDGGDRLTRAGLQTGAPADREHGTALLGVRRGVGLGPRVGMDGDAALEGHGQRGGERQHVDDDRHVTRARVGHQSRGAGRDPSRGGRAYAAWPWARCRRHQMRTRSAGSSQSPSPSWVPKVAWNSSRLRTMLARNSGGLCGSMVRYCWSSSRRRLVRQQ